MISKSFVRLWVTIAAGVTSAIERLGATPRDEGGSPTLETVVIAAGLLALALGLVVVIKAAVGHYAAQIN